MARPVVIGIDSSTQSTKAIAVEVATGQVVGEGRAPHAGTDTQDPASWWAALSQAVSQAVGSGSGHGNGLTVEAISVGGQQHGLVTLDAGGEPVVPASLWNNVAAAPDAERLNGEADFAAEVGTRLVAAVTIAKVAHLARTDPDAMASTAAICLPHDYLTLRLTGELTTDRGDASGSGWWSPASGETRRDLLALACGAAAADRLRLPAVLGPGERAGVLSAGAAAGLGLTAGIPVAPGTGDNMAAALGIGAGPGELVMSLGTSGTVFMVSEEPTADPTGEVCGFADATGRFLPLACMINCTRAFDLVAGLLGIGREEALARAGAVEPGAGGLLLLPYFGGERTPNLPAATGDLSGLTEGTLRPDLVLRAALDGVAAGIDYCLGALARVGVEATDATLVGGGSASPVWRQAIADATGLRIAVRGGGEHAARGAATQAAALILDEPVAAVAARWRPGVVAEVEPRPGTRAAFRLDERRVLIERARAAG
ncbi:MAG: FGGY family carbohydrate kinase [Thermomicrobiales bacterium]